MERTVKIIVTAMLTVVLLFAAGCVKEDNGPEQGGNTEVTVSPEYVPIDWNNAVVVTSDDSAGTYQIQFNGDVPDIHPGSIIAIDRDTVVLYRFVTDANIAGNMVNITSVEAYLTDIFANTEFTLTTAVNGSKSNANGAVIRPVAAYVIDENGAYHALNMNRKGETHFTHDLWHYGFNNDGRVLHAGAHDSIVLDKMNMDLDIDFEMYMNFSGRDVHAVVNDAIDRYMSRALKVNTALIGDFNTEQRIRCKSWGSSHVDIPAITVLPALFPRATIKFMAGPVPVIIIVRTDLCCQMEINTENVIQAYTGFSDHAHGRMGFKWSQASGMVPDYNIENNFNYTPPTLEGKGMIQAKVWVFPRINFFIYNIIGPTIDIMPYDVRTVRGGFREQMLGQSNDYCAWTYDHYTGLDLCGALNFNLFGRWFVDDILGGIADVHTPRKNITEKLMYHSPKKIVYASGSPHEGQPTTVSFNVYDQSKLHGWLLDQEVLTPLPQIVKFEANGHLSSEYGIATLGTVSVNWTPSGNDVLYAKLYDYNGNVISCDAVVNEVVPDNPDNPYFPAGDWVNLGLPSGTLWASRNVGASTITDYGYYYAWAETSPKAIYNISTYQYYAPSENGWWTVLKYNSLDGLTVLEPEDDAATVNYGGRTPTKEEWAELLQYTTSRWYTLNGVNGYCFTGSNGNSIFLPAAGWRSDGLLDGDGYRGNYWSSLLNEEHPSNAWTLDFYSEQVQMMFFGVVEGRSVRAVLSAR